MITDCPSCSRQFRIYAWQLSAAKGTVQCGFCGEQFNALERLHDHPLEGSDDVGGTVELDDSLDEPQFSIPEKEHTDDIRKIEAVDFEHKHESDLGEAAENIVIDPEVKFSHEPDTAPIGEEAVREILGEPVVQTSMWVRLLWFTIVSFLFFAILVQLTWFNRDWVLTRYPEYLPFARSICDRMDCEIVREKDLQSIILLNRDVRDHPRYTNTLLVNATIENQSKIVQPFPYLRMTLYNTDGQVTGYRTFYPQEYLDESIRIEDGMSVNVPVHIILELTGSTEEAVSFEFTFI